MTARRCRIMWIDCRWRAGIDGVLLSMTCSHTRLFGIAVRGRSSPRGLPERRVSAWRRLHRLPAIPPPAASRL